MNRLFAFITLLSIVNFLYAQEECPNCLKIQAMENNYYDSYWKIPNGYIVDERGDTFDYNLLNLNLTFSASNGNYMVYAGAFKPTYYRGDSIDRGLGHLTNLDTFIKNMPHSMVLVENRQGEIKLFSIRSGLEYPASFEGTELSVGFYQSFKIVDDSFFSMQIRVLNNSLRIKKSDTMVRFHYLYRPSIEHLRNYITNAIKSDIFAHYADSARCDDCSNVHLISNWFELTSESEVRIVKKEAIDNLLIHPRYRWDWPSKDIFQGNGLYELIFEKIEYTEDWWPFLAVEIFDEEDISVGLRDSSNRPIQILIPEKGLILYVNNKAMNDSNTGLIYSILLDIEGRYTRKAYCDQLPLALNYSDNLNDLKRRYEFSNEIEEGKYVHLYLQYGARGAKLSYDKKLQRISEVEIYFGSEDDLRILKSNN